MTTYAPTLPAGRVSLKGLLHSEWIKLRTLRSTLWTLGATIFTGVGISVATMWFTRAHWTTESPAARAAFDPLTVSLVGVYLGGSLVIGVLGILVVSGEYATGTIRATFAVEPRRLRVLAAKVLVFTAVTVVTSEVTSFASFLAGQAILTSPARHATLSSPGALRAVVGVGLFLGACGLLAFGIAVVVRHTAGAISAYVFVMLVLPFAIAGLPASLGHDIERFLPESIGAVIIGDGVPNGFAPWTGFGILCAYAAVVLAAGTVLLVRRDA